MGRASAAVKFPDGTIKYAMYCGTTDVLWPRLFDTIDQAWDAYETTKNGQAAYHDTFYPPEPITAAGEPVQIYENYGGGYEWEGRATRDFVVSELSLLEIDDTIDYELDTQPEWLIWQRSTEAQVP